MKKILQTLFSVLLVTLIALGCKPNSSKGGNSTGNSDGEGAFDSTKMAHFDTTHATSSDSNFVTQTIKSNIGEIQLSQLAQNKATSPDIKKVAAMMVQDHTQALNQLKGMASKKATVDETPSDITKSALENLGKLQGKDFDTKWAEQMLQIHENTDQEFRMMQTVTKDTAILQWLNKTIPVIDKHRDMLAKLAPKDLNKQSGQIK